MFMKRLWNRLHDNIRAYWSAVCVLLVGAQVNNQRVVHQGTSLDESVEGAPAELVHVGRYVRQRPFHRSRTWQVEGDVHGYRAVEYDLLVVVKPGLLHG